jgi:HEPN domain
VNHAELQRMAEERIQDAKALLDAGRWEFAYYVAGYAVECALKACMLRRMIYTGWIFDEGVKKLDECRTHEFVKLIQIAGMMGELNDSLKASAAAIDGFVTNWETTNEWNVTSRYESRSEAEARKLYLAITDEPYGVMGWIRNYW